MDVCSLSRYNFLIAFTFGLTVFSTVGFLICMGGVSNLYGHRHCFCNRWCLLCEDCSNNLFYKLFLGNLAKSYPSIGGPPIS